MSDGKDRRFQANLSHLSVETFVAYRHPLHISPRLDTDDSVFAKEVRQINQEIESGHQDYVKPALHGVSKIVGMGAVKIHCMGRDTAAFPTKSKESNEATEAVQLLRESLWGD